MANSMLALLMISFSALPFFSFVFAQAQRAVLCPINYEFALRMKQFQIIVIPFWPEPRDQSLVQHPILTLALAHKKKTKAIKKNMGAPSIISFKWQYLDGSPVTLLLLSVALTLHSLLLLSITVDLTLFELFLLTLQKQ